MSIFKKAWRWTKKSYGKVLVGAGTVLSAIVPPIGAPILAAGSAVEAVKAAKNRGGDSVSNSSANTIDKILAPEPVMEVVTPGEVPNMLSNINPMYLVAAGGLLLLLLFRK